MPMWAWIIIVAAAVLVVVAVAAMYTRRRKTSGLQEQFGSEYDRTVDERDSRRDAERELMERTKQRERLDIIPLSDDARDRYADSWRTVQSQFVDDPSGAVHEADSLVTEVMRERGYPIDDFEQRAADISVDHPEVVENYRAGHDLYVKEERGDAGTEDLRQAFVHYRALFAELLETRERDFQEVR